ncbi:hypothetical protein BH09VER1_BH09VER1_51210 [soil metagenome]
MRQHLRFLYYSNAFVRWSSNIVAGILRPEARPPSDHLVTFRGDDAIGPLQRDEALLLLGLVRTTRPQTIVEFGFHYGHSAFNFLQAMDQSAKLYSFDIADHSEAIARKYFNGFSNFTFTKKSQDQFTHTDVDERLIDLVFLDGAHHFEITTKTFEAILPHLADDAIIAIHDTGTWARVHMQKVHKTFTENLPTRWLNDEEYIHEVDERRFVNWIVETYPEFGSMHFHSKNLVRHGLTLLQRRSLLPVATKRHSQDTIVP